MSISGDRRSFLSGLAMRKGRGRNLTRVAGDLAPLMRGWMAYFRLAETKGDLESLDEWVRRKLRCIRWRQWRRPRTRMRALVRAGIAKDRAVQSVGNGRGPWWNAGASHMNQAVPAKALRQLWLVSFLDEHRRLARS